MKNYELTLILSPLASETEMNDLIGTIVSFLQEQGGLLSNQSTGKRMRLSYPIKKQTEGTLTTLTFTLSPDKLKVLDAKLKEDTFILRYMLINKVVKASTVKSDTPRLAPTTTETRVKADSKEIEEKLEEIFKEATNQ